MVYHLFDPAILSDTEDTLEFITSHLQALSECAIIGLNLDGIISLWSEGARQLYGYEAEDIVGQLNIATLDIFGGHDENKINEILAVTLQTTKWEGNLVRQCKNGDHYKTRVFIKPRYDDTGEARGFFMICTDISKELRLIEELNLELKARLLAESALRETDQRYRITTETAPDAIISSDQYGTVIFINTAAERIFGHPIKDMYGNNIDKIMPGAIQLLQKSVTSSSSIDSDTRVILEAVEFYGLHSEGHQIPLELSFGEGRHDGKKLFTIIARDISERKRADNRIHYLAQRDALTELPNRSLLQDRIEQALAQAHRKNEKVAVLFLDLDGFKHINDSVGHQIGDQLLRMVSQRLRYCLREGDSVGRLGGDEFVICLAITNASDAAFVAEKILESLNASMQVDEHDLYIGASIGISLFPADGDNTHALMRTADIAMYHAKEKGRNNYQFFTNELNDAAQQRIIITSRLHQALQHNEFTLVYQPQVDLSSGKIFAAEALLRWRRPDGYLMLPSNFIKIAEETGLIVEIGKWVLHEACRQLSHWRQSGYPDLRVAVNISPGQFRRSGFLQQALHILRETELPASALDLEITEGVIMQQNMENISMLSKLAGAGVQIAVDDFGTGYSNLAYLQRFPIDTIKIDRSFLTGLGNDHNNSAIVTAIIVMAKNLNLHVVAEGVETAEQVEFLKNRHCLAAQGFYFHVPVSAKKLSALLEKQARYNSGTSTHIIDT